MRPFSTEYIIKSLKILAPFIGKSLLVMVLSVFFGTVLGFFLAWGRLSKCKVCKSLSSVYVHIIRCTPSIVLLFIVYYGLPKLGEIWFGIRAGYNGKLLYVVITLSLLFASAMCELFRSSYESVDVGQSEAAFTLGMSKFQTARLIIIPQALSSAFPVFCNEVVSLLKQGSLAFTIGFIDLMGEAQVIVARDYGAHGLETYIALALIYWAITIFIEQITNAIERGRNKWN